MKKYLFLPFVVGLLLTTPVDAQHERRTGPRAKNSKPWQNDAPATAVYSTTYERITGPEAKNSRPGDLHQPAQRIRTNARRRMIGLEAKNCRPERPNQDPYKKPSLPYDENEA